jgi:hypothetical protein
MFSSLLLLAASAVGVNYGWEPLPEGGMKYIVQFEPDALVEAQKAGVPLDSDIPSHLSNVRSISIRLGTGPVPQENPVAKTEVKSSAPIAESQKPESSPPDFPAKPQNSTTAPPLLQNPQGNLLTVQKADFTEPAEASKTGKEPIASATSSSAGEPTKPWFLFTFVSILLFASLGGNVYLLWIFAELRKRYRALLVK